MNLVESKKNCAFCVRNEGNQKPQKCFKSYIGSSDEMETKILIEGFKFSAVIDDGDSSTYKN